MNGNRYATARAATTLSGLAALSPLAGIVVEIALAWRFGASPTVDAFRIGMLVLIFGQQLFVIQILPHAVVPVFAEYRARGQEKEAWHVALSLANLLVVPAILFSLLVFFHPEPIVGLLAPGLAGEARELAAMFVRWFLPTTSLLVWSGVVAGVLYAHRVFWLPPATQLAGNVAIVLSILSLGRTLGAGSLVLGVMVSAVISATVYLVKLIPLMRQADALFPWKLDVTHPGVRKMLSLALPLLGTVLLGQWAATVINRVLSELPPGSLALFGYAWKLCLVVSVLPLALATVLFPRFAETHQSFPAEEFRGICMRAMRMALFIAIPLACLLYALRSRVVALLFERGAFSAEASETVARLFGLLVIGAPAAVALAYMEKITYAVQNTWIPACYQLATALLLTLFAPVLTVSSGAGRLALFYSSLVWLIAGGLVLWLSLRWRALSLGPLLLFAVRIFLLALLSAWLAQRVAALSLSVSGSRDFSAGFAAAEGLAVGSGVFCGVFFGVALGWEIPEVIEGRDYLYWQGRNIAGKLHDFVLGRT